MKKILIIEDNTDIRENLQEILELADYQTFIAENGKIGVEVAERELPNLILCDVMMPVLDGYGVLKILNKKPQTADIPFIFLTAKAERTDFRYGMNLGADDYITKPFETNELLETIELRLKKYEKTQQVFDKNQHNISAFINEAKGLDALKNLNTDRETRLFTKKNSIYKEGTTPRHLYFIQKGKIKIVRTNEEGKELIISILNENDFFGHLPLLSEERYADNAVALEDSEISMIPKEDFFALLQNNRDVAAKFIKILAQNVNHQEEQLLHLAYNSVRKRVADALIAIYESYKNDDAKGFSILREDIASMAGTAKETAIRTLTDFKEDGLIDIQNGKIIILKIEKLKNLFN
jgi:CRP/FNR family transcriptional regulator, polysaccharide utilization system transcription regulator